MVTKGDVPVNITWHLNGKPVREIKGITVTKIGHKSSSLSIDSVASIHTGVFTCSATNQAGYANYSSELAVNGNLTSTQLQCSLLLYICFKAIFQLISTPFQYYVLSICLLNDLP